jgi:hypothetical protein
MATIKTDVPLPSDWGAFISGKVTAQCDENDVGFDCAAEKDAVFAEASGLQLLISFKYAVDGSDTTTDNDHDFGTTTFSGSISYSPIPMGQAESVSFGNVKVVVTDSIPEPSTWALMLLGFAGLGFAGYRRTRVAVSAA